MKKLFGHARLAAFEAARKAIYDRYAKTFADLSADREAELRELDRRYWDGVTEPPAQAA